MAFPLPLSLKQSLDATKVEYTSLGSSGLKVSVPILGTMSMGSSKWANWVLDEDKALPILKAAYDMGLNTWDTANAYSNGLSEAVIAKAIKEYNIPREKVVLMTKCWGIVAEDIEINAFMYGQAMAGSKDYVNRGGLSRTAIFNQVEASLRALQTSYIDVLQIHRVDPSTPISETMKALHDLVQMGKVRYIGASSMWTYQFATMQAYAEANNLTKFVSMQNIYNLCYREEEREMNKYCKETGVGLIPWSPMHGGLLARPVGTGDSARAKFKGPMTPVTTDADEETIKRVEKTAKDKGWTMAEVSLVWVKQKGATPIVGFNSVARVEEMAGLKGKALTDDEIKFLEEPYVPKNVFGHW